MNEQCHTVIMDDADYQVNFDYQPEEKPVYDLNSPMCGPGCAAGVSINSIQFRPHGYSHWIQTDLAKWDMKTGLWEFLESECMASVEYEAQRQKEGYYATREYER